jgi:DHA2 family multidrug resistance protein
MKARDDERQPTRRDWIAIFGAILGAFMAVLDIQITNASLKYIQGGLAASLDEGTWISTAYLIAEIITIPLSPWLSEIFSTKRYLLVNCALFLLFSMLCGLSTNLPEMIIFRAGQGFTGRRVHPDRDDDRVALPAQIEATIRSCIVRVTATFAPAIGPTLGGWLTDTFSWRWIFYINLLPGLAMMWAVWYGLEGEAMKLDQLRRGDWVGIVCMAIGLGSLITVLEEGEHKEWSATR